MDEVLHLEALMPLLLLFLLLSTPHPLLLLLPLQVLQLEGIMPRRLIQDINSTYTAKCNGQDTIQVETS